MRHSVEDRFLGGRGVSWVRYEPHIREQTGVGDPAEDDGYQVTEDVEAEGSEDQTAGQEEAPEEIAYECSPTDYVHWSDFGHSVARTWEEVSYVWRWVYMTKEAVAERFGKDIAKKIPMDNGPEKLDKSQLDKAKDKAKICELWDKERGVVVWFSKNYPDTIDERDDPLNIEGFFPCPRPLYATTTSDSLVPVPDFVLYQDQANELDILSDRIDGLVKALRVRGVYDSSQPALQRLLTEGDNNTLIPVEKWGAFSEKGGLKGTIDLLPLDTIATALLQCYQARQDIKGQIYEITGISDIIRGQSAASETATAQQIKGQYAGLRLKSMQETVALFASELLRIKAQIICQKYQPQTILAYAAAEQLSPEDQQMIPQALQLLKNKPLQSFRIEVAADSLVQIDENQNKQDRMEFLNAFANFMREAVPAGQQAPEMVPALMAMMKYAVGGFRQAKTIEGTIDQALQQLTAKAAQAAANPQPHPEESKAKADMAQAQAKGQVDMQVAQAKAQADLAARQAEMQGEAQIEQIKGQNAIALDAARFEHEKELKSQELLFKEAYDKWKVQFEAATSIVIAQIAHPEVDPAAEQAEQAATENVVKGLGETMQTTLNSVASSHQDLAKLHTDAMDKISTAMQTMNAPKRVVRGPDGRVTGVETAE